MGPSKEIATGGCWWHAALELLYLAAAGPAACEPRSLRNAASFQAALIFERQPDRIERLRATAYRISWYTLGG